MSTPSSRADLKEYIKRALGYPVINVEVSDDQIDDRIDDALKKYWDYHFDGADHVYYKHQVTQTDHDNKYITLPDDIWGAVRIFPIGNGFVSTNMFDIRYQLMLNDLYSITSQSIVPYYMMMQHIQLLEQVLVGQQPIRFNRKNNKLHIDMSWERLPVGHYIVVEAYQIIDPDTHTSVWNDQWLIRYATQLVKKQWGNNIKKFGNMQMPGGVVFNGQAIYDEAQDELVHLESELINTYSLPVYDMIG